MASSHPRCNFSFQHLFLALFAFLAIADAQQKLSNLPKLGPTTREHGVKSSAHSHQSSTSSSLKQSAPTITTTTSLPPGGRITNVPTLYGVGTPPLIVPDTADAPFMQKSNLPQGTVFICVGAALGFLGMSVLAWRGLVAWSLHRSVRRAARSKHASESKSAHGGLPPVHNSNMHPSTNMTLEHLANSSAAYNGSRGQGHGRHSKPPRRTSAQVPTNGSLFYSPTAGTATAGPNRSSTYLPAGFYASGASIAAAGSGVTQLGGQTVTGYGRTESSRDLLAGIGQAKQDSANKHRSHGRGGSNGRDVRGSGMSLNSRPQRGEHQRSGGATETARPGQRAPSTVLDDLFQHRTSRSDGT